LNLRRNPFGEPERSERAALAVVDDARLAEWLGRLRAPGFALQFVGEAGRGKSTHLLALHRHFPEAPFVYVGERERPRLPAGAPFFLDEAQRVGRLRLRRLFRRGGSIVIGSHRDHTRELHAAGLEVETVFPAAELEPGVLARMLERRIGWARRAAGPVPQIDAAAVRGLHQRHGSDIRAIERALYRVFQQAEGIGDVAL
jgi:hypothetical protein